MIEIKDPLLFFEIQSKFKRFFYKWLKLKNNGISE